MAIDKSHENEVLELRSIGNCSDFSFQSSLSVNVIPISRTLSDASLYKPSRPKKQVLFLHEHTYLKRWPAQMTCPNCLCGVETVVYRQNSITTHLFALLLLPICLCMLPYFSKVLRDSVHRCPSCGINLGSKFASAHEAFVVCMMTQQDSQLDELYDIDNGSYYL